MNIIMKRKLLIGAGVAAGVGTVAVVALRFIKAVGNIAAGVGLLIAG